MKIVTCEEFKEIELDENVVEVECVGIAPDGYHYSYQIVDSDGSKYYVGMTPEENEKY